MTVSVQDPINNHVGNDATVLFGYSFRILAAEDLKVYLDGTLQGSGYTVAGVGDAGGGSVTFDTAPATAEVVRLQRIVAIKRDTDYVDGGALLESVLDADHDRHVMQVQDLDRVAFKESSTGDLDAGTRKLVNLVDPTNAQDGATKAWAERVGSGSVGDAAASAAAALVSENNAAASEASAAADAATTTADAATTTQDAIDTAADAATTTADVLITNADVITTNADVVLTNADVITTNADVVLTNADAVSTDTDATNAAASAAAAISASNSLIWNDVTFKSFADSPITLTDADRGVLFSIDTSGGAVVINLPLISAVTMPFTIGVKKSTGDVNSITINRSGTDTINNGLTSLTTDVLDAGWTFVGDTDPVPDVWSALKFGPASSTVTSVAGKIGDVTLVPTDVGAVDITGDVMTGALDITAAVHRKIALKSTTAVQSRIDFLADNGDQFGEIYSDPTAGTFKVSRLATNGTTVAGLEFGADGNVELTGTATAPSATGDLTRKDYVDDNFLPVYDRTSSIDLNDYTAAQTIGLGDTLTNAPDAAASYGTMIVTRSSVDSSNQLVFGRDTAANRMWMRGWNGTSWTAWVEQATQDYVDGEITGLSSVYLGISAKAADSDLLDNRNLATASTANTVVQRDVSGDINARLFRSEYDTTNSDIGFLMSQVNTTTNNYMRPSTAAHVRAFTGQYATKEIDLLIWNMQSTASKSFSHGLTFTNIRKLSALIIEDNSLKVHDFTDGVISVTSSLVTITRTTGGIFDDTAFNSPTDPGQRGWIVIEYVE